MLINGFRIPFHISVSLDTSQTLLAALDLALCMSYLAGVGAFAQAGAKHAVGDVVAVDIWLSANLVGDQSDSGLLQTGVSLGLCQIERRTAMARSIIIHKLHLKNPEGPAVL